MRLDTLEITVVGGAIGGATAALLLAQAGARVTLVERVAEPRAVGAGIGIAENGLAVLNALGFGAALERLGREVRDARIVDGHRRPLLTPRGTPRVLMLRRSDLHTLLLDAVARHPRIRPCFGLEVLRAGADGTILLRDDNGRETQRRADLVIGADGVHSSVRSHGAFGARLRTGIAYVRGLAPAGLSLSEEAWTSEGLFGSFDVSEGTYFYCSLGRPALRVAVSVGDANVFRAAWARAYPACAPLLENVDMQALLVNQVTEVRCARWVDGRCVLLGDAAHAMAPNLGQGANSALVDGAVLLDELARHDTLEAALRAYEARRNPRVHEVQTLSARLGRLAELRHPWLRWMRDRLLLPVANRAASASSAARVLQEPAARLEAGILERARAVEQSA